MKNKSKQELSRKQITAQWQNAIKDYINYHIENDTFIKSRIVIYRELEKDKKLSYISQQTFYRYLKKMKCVQIQIGKYDFATDETLNFNNLLCKRNYTNRIYFYIIKPSLGNYIAKIINEHFEDYKDFFHCIALQDLLICYYAKSYLSRDEICKDISNVLSSFTLVATEMSD